MYPFVIAGEVRLSEEAFAWLSLPEAVAALAEHLRFCGAVDVVESGDAVRFRAPLFVAWRRTGGARVRHLIHGGEASLRDEGGTLVLRYRVRAFLGLSLVGILAIAVGAGAILVAASVAAVVAAMAVVSAPIIWLLYATDRTFPSLFVEGLHVAAWAAGPPAAPPVPRD